MRRDLRVIEEFLLASFEPKELGHLLTRHLDESVYADLPTQFESPRLYFARVVEVLQHRGLINASLFQFLLAVRPQRLSEIESIASLLSIQLEQRTQVGRTAQAREPRGAQGQRAEWVEELESLLLVRERLMIDDPNHDGINGRVDDLTRRLSDTPYSTNTVVCGQYQLERIEGAGNFGSVWRARDLNGNSGAKTVAVKIFHLNKLADGVMLWRFRRSIRALEIMSKYRNAPPSIPRLIAVQPDTLAFIMPHFSGGTLENVARRGWTLATKVDKFLHICRAAEFAHKLGIIHRDIKPGNVLLDAQSQPVLIDYDIADIGFVTRLSLDRGGLGTPMFAAPEQLEDANSANEQSDIYSLGRLLYYLLLERSPGYQIERDPTLENISAFPSSLVGIVRRAIQWNPRRRFASVHELIRSLERYQTTDAAIRARLHAVVRWAKGNAAVLVVASSLTGAAMAVAWKQHENAELRASQVSMNEAHIADYRKLIGDLDSLNSRVEFTLIRRVSLVGNLEETEAKLTEALAASPAGQDLSSRREVQTLRTQAAEISAKIRELDKSLGASIEDIKSLRQRAPEPDTMAPSFKDVLDVARHAPATPSPKPYRIEDEIILTDDDVSDSDQGSGPPPNEVVPPERVPKLDKKIRFSQLPFSEIEKTVNRSVLVKCRQIDRYSSPVETMIELDVSKEGGCRVVGISVNLSISTKTCVTRYLESLRFPRARAASKHAYSVAL